MAEVTAQTKKPKLTLEEVLKMIDEWAKATGRIPGPTDFGHPDVQSAPVPDGTPPLPDVMEIKRDLFVPQSESGYDFIMSKKGYSEEEIKRIRLAALPARKPLKRIAPKYGDLVREPKPEKKPKTAPAVVAPAPEKKPAEPQPEKVPWPEEILPPRPPKPPPDNPNEVVTLTAKLGWGDSLYPPETEKPDS